MVVLLSRGWIAVVSFVVAVVVVMEHRNDDDDDDDGRGCCRRRVGDQSWFIFIGLLSVVVVDQSPP